MRLNRKTLRKMIFETLNLLNEENLSKEEEFKEITKDDIKFFPKNGTGRFAIYRAEDIRSKGASIKDHIKKLASENGFKKHRVFSIPDKGLQALVELQAPVQKKKEKVNKNVITGSNIEFVGMQLKAHSLDYKEYDFFKNPLGIVLAVKRDSNEYSKFSKLQKLNYSDDAIEKAMNYKPF